MLGKPNQLQPKLFYNSFSLEQRVHEDHPLRKVKNLIDFSFIRSEVKDLYGYNGNQSIDPAVILKLMFLLFYENIKSERALANQLPVRLDWLWFCDYDIDDKTPNHSVISKARQRWGVDVFAKFFQNILLQCIDANLLDGEVVHIDSSTIKANASKDKVIPKLKLLSENLYNELDENTEDKSENPQKISKTDPDASFGKKKGSPSVLGYKDHRAVDDKHGIITATVTTAANIRDDKVFDKVLEESIANTQLKPSTAVADSGYSYENNFEYLYDSDIQSCISQRGFGNITCQDFSRDHFVYNAESDCFTCPAGQKLTRLTLARDNGVVKYRAERQTCQSCEYLSKCVRSSKNGRIVSRKIGMDYRHWAYNCLSRETRFYLLKRRKHKIEGSFADASNNHGFKKARYRGLEKVTIQNLLIATIQNLRKLLKVNSLKPTVSMAKSANCVLHDITCAISSRLIHCRTVAIAKLSEYSVFKELFQLFRFKLLFS
jgi:transposase